MSHENGHRVYSETSEMFASDLQNNFCTTGVFRFVEHGSEVRKCWRTNISAENPENRFTQPEKMTYKIEVTN